VPAGASVVLAPGGMHLMLMKAGAPVVAGKHYRLSVSCNGASATFDATVRREEPSTP
jgi:copper(I)-binding protein